MSSTLRPHPIHSLNMLIIFACLPLASTGLIAIPSFFLNWAKFPILLGCFSLLTLILIKKQQHFWAKWMVYLVPATQITISNYIYYPGIGLHFFYLGMAVFVPIIFTAREQKSRILVTAILIFLFMIGELLNPESALRQPDSINTMLLFSVLLLFSASVGFLFVFTHQIDRYEASQIQLIEDLKRKNSEIKILQGLLPICSSCKKIRDDNGYWNQLENYLHDHSEASLTHSICPDCAEELYGDQPWF